MEKPRTHLRVALAASTSLLMAICPTAHAQSKAHEYTVADAELLTQFGGRANFSPDGQKIAFVGKTYGDAYEIDLKTREIRNLTYNIPHQGIMRIQYLPNGDFLVTAPHVNTGPNTRAHLEMWVLGKDLNRGLQPLGEQVFEGIAISKKTNLIAWTVIEPELKREEPWQMAFVRPTKRYIAEVTYKNGKPRLTEKREIMARLPEECKFIEPQDFREDDSELVYSCMGMADGGNVQISVMGNKLREDRNVIHYRKAGEYDEVEGIAPGGDWTTVECGKQDKPGLPVLDICRLELTPDGKITRLVRGTTPGSTVDISNPVVSPDGKWLAFQRSDNASPDIGEGFGLYLLKLGD
ncbi:MAG: PD40 domain-containing protein [Novosphingobium sp.]|nr:PD40 domain-containing protein [Novosphingobium sp.]MCP5403856.1 PD40 domain-containing protein [Novosphingobium sp.]